MKRWIAVVSLAASVVSVNAATLPAVTVACGQERTVYINDSTAGPVVVQVFAQCSQGASVGVFVKGRSSPLKKYDVPGGQVQAIRVSVELNGSIKIDFKGNTRGTDKEAKYVLSIP